MLHLDLILPRNAAQPAAAGQQLPAGLQEVVEQLRRHFRELGREDIAANLQLTLNSGWEAASDANGTQEQRALLHLDSCSPMVAAAGRPLAVRVEGTGVTNPDVRFHMRHRGADLQLQQTPAGPSSIQLTCSELATRGLVIVEAQCSGSNGLPSNWLPVVVVPHGGMQAEVAGEVERLGPGSPSSRQLVTDLGLWLDFVEERAQASRAGVEERAQASRGGAPSATASSHDSDSGAALVQLLSGTGSATPRSVELRLGTGLHLLAHAARRGWPHTVACLLSGLVTAGLSLGEVEARCSAGGKPGLLHNCAASGQRDMVAVLQAVAEVHGHTWDWARAGPDGKSALHVAAALNDGGAMAQHLLTHVPGAAHLWRSLRAADGSTPAP